MSNSSKKHGLTITIENASHEIFWYEDDNGNVFFNATAIWKAAGSPANRRPFDYKRSEDGQGHIVQQYRTLTTNTSPGHLSFDPDTWVYKKGTSLPDEVLSHFEKTTRGYNGGTFMIELVAMDYAQWVSVQVKDEILRTYSAFGGVTRAIQDGRTDDAVIALDEAAKAVVAAELESEGEVATAKRIKARQDSIIARCGLTDAIRDRKLESSLSYGTVTDMINLAIFGHRARVLRTGLELPLKGRESPRTFASTNCNYAFKYAESMLTDNILKGTCRCTDDVQRILGRFQPMLQSMANHLGDEPVLLERNDRTWQLAEGETTASLKNKELTHQD